MKKELISEITDKVQQILINANNQFTFIADSGNYKERTKYKISNQDWPAKLQQQRQYWVDMHVNLILMDSLISTNKGMMKRYKELEDIIAEELNTRMKAKIAVKKSPIKGVKNEN